MAPRASLFVVVEPVVSMLKIASAPQLSRVKFADRTEQLATQVVVPAILPVGVHCQTGLRSLTIVDETWLFVVPVRVCHRLIRDRAAGVTDFPHKLSPSLRVKSFSCCPVHSFVSRLILASGSIAYAYPSCTSSTSYVSKL